VDHHHHPHPTKPDAPPPPRPAVAGGTLKEFVSYETKPETITKREYSALQEAYDLFNVELFARCKLPDLLVTFQRRPKTRGYFAAERFHGRVDKDTVAHELALNPDVFTEQSDELILSTLVHEMTHAWQQTHGKVPRRGYHDKQWAAKMKEIGLWPSSTGDLNGKETGQNVSHYIIPDGAYASAYKKLAATGFRVNWESQPEADRRKRQVGRASKTKYTCRVCRANAWARPRSKLICGDCYLADQEITMMLATDTEEDAPCTRQP
jgi:predicted SprT family Zn-dependent metalloprotease